MKRKFSFKLMVIMLCIITVIQIIPIEIIHSGMIQVEAGETGGVKKGLELYKKGNYSEAKKQFSKYTKKASEPCIKNMSDKMKQTYLKKVLEFQTFTEILDNTEGGEYIWAYFLTDINKDGIAELLIQHGSCEADCMITIYRFNKNIAEKVKSISGAHSILYSYPDGNGFIRLTGYMGYETITLITLQGNKVSEMEIGSRDIGSGSYMYFPYKLANHVTSDGLDIDYSSLK